MEFEAKPETSQEKAETVQETPLKQADTVSDTPIDTAVDTLADTSPDTDTDTEQGVSVSKVNQAICLKVKGFSYRAIAEKTGLSFATVARVLKGVSLENSAGTKDSSPVPQKNNSTVTNVSSVPLSSDETSLVEAVQPQQPENYFLKPGLTSQEWSELSKKDKASLLAMVGELRAQNSSLQASAVMRKGNGDATYRHNGDSTSTDSEASFWAELAKTERVERALRIRDRYSTPDKKEYPADVKSILEVFKIFQPKQANEYEVYRQGRLDEQKNLETVSRNSETNVNDIKLEELKQNREIDMEKLRWEQTKWQQEKDEDNRKWSWVGKVLDGPIGKMVSQFGQAGVERVRGKRLPKAVQTQCPNCKGTIYVDAQADTAICGTCGSILQKQTDSGQPSTTNPSESPIPEESKEENASVEEKTQTGSEVKKDD